MCLSTALTWYVIMLVSVIIGLGFSYSVRNPRFRSSNKLERVFRCAVCGYVYTDDSDVDRSRCPQCTTLNDPFRF